MNDNGVRHAKSHAEYEDLYAFFVVHKQVKAAPETEVAFFERKMQVATNGYLPFKLYIRWFLELPDRVFD